MKDGVPQPDILAKWAANAPLAFVDQYIGNLKQYRGIAMDVGDQDGLRVDAAKLHDVFDKYGIANSFEIYPGTHTSAVADRFQNHVLPFFSRSLFSSELPGRKFGHAWFTSFPGNAERRNQGRELLKQKSCWPPRG